MMPGRLIGIDHGLKRIGLAVSDALGMTARELTIIKRKSRAEDFQRIQHIVHEQQAVAFVVGMPHNDGEIGGSTQANSVLRWVDQLREAIPLPVIFWDEQLSSSDARELAGKRRKPSAPIDDLAARVILQSYLDAVRDGLAELPGGGD